MVGAFLSILLLMVARHHPPSRRKIKEIWHGRVYWERESNTTMLRSSTRVTNTTVADTVDTTVDTTADSTVDTTADTADPSTKREMQVMVSVLSRRSAFETRQTIRETWASGHNNVFFVVGTCCPIPPNDRLTWTCKRAKSTSVEEQSKWDMECDKQDLKIAEEEAEYRDIIRMPDIDVYRHLPQKVKFSYKWGLEHTTAKWFVKTDDDSVVRIDTLGSYLEKTYTSDGYVVVGRVADGWSVPRSGKWAENNYRPSKYPKFPLGSVGHVVSKGVASYIADNSDELFNYQGEDVSIGIWLDESPLKSKVKWVTSKHMTNHGNCKDTGMWVMGHDIKPAEMRECFAHKDEIKSASEPQTIYAGVKLIGGLGNNLFMLASIQGIAHKNNVIPCYSGSAAAKELIEIDIEKCPSESYEKQFENGYAIYTPFKLTKSITIGAYLQSYKYFKSIPPFKIKQNMNSFAQKYVNTHSTKTTNVGIHVRRGDHLKHGYLNFPGEQYFKNAMQYFTRKYGDVQFFVASNDISWCKKQPLFKGTHIISEKHTAAQDLAILANCDHVIVSLGTFGWWSGLLSGGEVVYNGNEFDMKHKINKGKVVKQDHYPPEWIEMSAVPVEEKQKLEAPVCVPQKGMWHVMIVWGHGLANYESIIDIVHGLRPSIRVWFQKLKHVDSIATFVNQVYQEDVVRVGASHIAAKTKYLQTVGDKIGVIVLLDPNPDLKTYGTGKWKMTANKRIVDLKWDIRRKFNPNPTRKSKRDSKGVFSHHHVVHISDTDEGIDSILKNLKLPTTSALQRTHRDFFTPWFIPPPKNYKVEMVKVSTLKIGCAVSAGKCVKGSSVKVSDSPHYAFASGDEDVYASYYTSGRLAGALTDDHTVESFHRLQKSFNPNEYPSCRCGYDGVRRKSMILIDKNGRIMDGAHRAALLLVDDPERTVEVVRLGGKGAGVLSCQGVERERVTEPPEGTQMGREQIKEILSVLPKDGNLLVWGLGNDSPFWHDSTDGKVVFIEDDIPEKKAGTLWFDLITSKYPFLEAQKVHYTTDTVKSYDRYMQHSEFWDIELDIRDQLPDSFANTRWDVILVDAPLGCCNAGPGRYQSIYTSKLLSNPDTHVFIDDYERKVEKQFSLKVFDKQPIRVIERPKAASKANAQAHFVQVSSMKKRDNRPIVALYCTGAFVDMTKNLLLQLQRTDWANVHRIELLALDETTAAAFSSFPKVHVRRHRLAENIASTNYGTENFRKITIHKAWLLEQLLDAAATATRPILFMDSDIVLLKQLIPFLESYEPNADILIQTNKVNANTGFIFIRPTQRAVKFIRAWDAEYRKRLGNKHHKWGGMSDQAVFNDLPRSDVQVTYLPSRRFPTGGNYFNNVSPTSPVLKWPKDDKVLMFHNNGIIGLEKKIQRLKSLDLWYSIPSSSGQTPSSVAVSWLQRIQTRTPTVLFKVSDTFPNELKVGDDVDVLVGSIDAAVAAVHEGGVDVSKCKSTVLGSGTQVHLDYIQGGKIYVRLDLYEAFAFPDVSERKAPTVTEVFAAGIPVTTISGWQYNRTSLEHECRLRWMEWAQWHKKRPDKIKHLKWMEKHGCASRRSSRDAATPGVLTKTGVPKIVHQTYSTTDLPPLFETWRQECMAMNPEWTFRLWTDADNDRFVQEYYPEQWELYNGYDVTIKRIDMVRYLYLHHYGGIYIDLDIACLRPWPSVMTDTTLFWVAQNGPDADPYQGGWSNQFMMAPPNRTLLQTIIHTLPHHAHKNVLYATGPGFLSQFLRTAPTTEWNAFRQDQVYGHGYADRNMCTSAERCRQQFPNAMTVSLFTHSWKSASKQGSHGSLTSRQWSSDVSKSSDVPNVLCTIEVPRGSTIKYEAGGMSRTLAKPMIANYGFVPNTLVSAERRWDGGMYGDGDPLDCIVVGDALPVNTTTRMDLQGVLKMEDHGQFDWKLVGRREDHLPRSDISRNEWEKLQTWFATYKTMVNVRGIGSRNDALTLWNASVIPTKRYTHGNKHTLR